MSKDWLRSVRRGLGTAAENKVPLHARLGDWTGDMRAESKYAEGLLDQLTLPGAVSAIAYEPGMGYLAVGTSVGSVHLFGAPCVRLSLTLRPAQRVKQLVFKSDTYQLICIDEKFNISIYDLSRRDPHGTVLRSQQPGGTARRVPPGAAGMGGVQFQLADAPMRTGIHTARNSVLCTEVSACHSHLFLGMADGSVDTYDLDRLAPSPYRIPNLWFQQEELLRRSGVPDAPSRLHIPLIVDIAAHPKDLNLLLLCYEGGAVLYSLKDKATLMAYQLRLLPGAPGPDARAPLEHIWSERMCPATAISWSPDGDMFVVGHDNGCLSFWNMKDEDKPLVVRTLDDVDIDRPVAPEELAQRPSGGPREPIFKLAWSGFPPQGWYGSAAPEGADAPTCGSVLTVMGGTTAQQTAASLCTLHLPPAAPASSGLWTSTSPEALHRVRVALQQSLVPQHVLTYRTSAIVEDFILLPRISPHYRNTFDPYAIVVLVGPDDALPSVASQASTRGLESYSFPPRPAPQPYAQLSLPLPLLFLGHLTLLGCRFESVPVPVYRQLVAAPDDAAGPARGSVSAQEPMGGYAQPNVSGATLAHAPGMARARRPRVLITWHLDGSVRVFDASPHLLLLGESQGGVVVLQKPFPASLPHLTVHVPRVVMHPAVSGSPALASLQRRTERVQVADVVPAWEARELAVLLASGHVLHLAFEHAPFMRSADPGVPADAVAGSMADLSVASAASAPSPIPVQEFTSLQGTGTGGPGFQPHAMLHVLPSSASVLALSDVGLLAVASGTMLVVIDTHQEDVVLRAGFGHADFHSHQMGPKEEKLAAAEGRSEITALTFAVCRVAEDPVLAPRLLVTRADGLATVWTLELSSLDSWFAYRSACVQLEPHGRHVHSAVLDARGNVAQMADSDVQRAKIDQERGPPGGDDAARDFCILLAVFERGVVLRDQVTGARIARAELPDAALAARVVDRNGLKVLVAVSPSSIMVYSLPRLDTSFRIQRHVPSSHEVVAAPRSVSLESQGDFVELGDGQQARMWTAMASQPHGEIPSMFLFTPRPLPLGPGAGASEYIASVASWFGSSAGSALSSGAQLDALLAGARRPAAPALPARIALAPDAPAADAGTDPHAAPRASADGAVPAPAAAAPGGTWLGSLQGYQQQFSALAGSGTRSQAQLNMQLLHKRDEILSNGPPPHAWRDPARSCAAVEAARRDLHIHPFRRASTRMAGLDEGIAQLLELAAATDDVDACYCEWSARSPGVACGPEFVSGDVRPLQPDAAPEASWAARLDGRTVRISPQSLFRACTPILCSDDTRGAGLLRAPRPLPGLSAFKATVQAELRFLQKLRQHAGRTDSVSSNAPFMHVLYDELVYALLLHSPVTALNAVFATTPSDGKPVASEASSTRVNIVAEGGRVWIRIMSLKIDALRDHFRHADTLAMEDNDGVLPTADDAVDSSAIVETARCLTRAAAASQTRPTRVELVLSRIDAPHGQDAPAIDSAAYWTAPEEERAKWRLQAIARVAMGMGVAVRFGRCPRPQPAGVHAHARGAFLALPRPPAGPPLHGTPVINLDVSALLALVSEVTHRDPGADATEFNAHANRALREQCAHESTRMPLLRAMARTFAPNVESVSLVATPEALDKFLAIVDAVGSTRERERASLLCGTSSMTPHERSRAFWDLSPAHRVHESEFAHSAKLIQLPVRRSTDEQVALGATYESDPLAAAHGARMRAALPNLAGTNAPRPKSLAASPHTARSLAFGLGASITTLTAHAHGIEELADSAGAPAVPASAARETAAEAHMACIWLIRPRSLTKQVDRELHATSRTAPAAMHTAALPAAIATPLPMLGSSATRTSEDKETLAGRTTVWCSNGDPEDADVHGADDSSTDSAASATPALHQPVARHPRLRRLWRWLEGPDTAKEHVLRHYPWWPWGPLENAWLRLTARVAWKEPPRAGLPAWFHSESGTEQVELGCIPGAPPVVQPSIPPSRGRAWFSKMWRDLRYNCWHWALLAAVCIGWLFGFAVLVHQNWFEPQVLMDHGWTTPANYECTETFWLRNGECGLNGVQCAPFAGSTVPFRCEGGCSSTTLLNPRTIGDKQYNYIPLIVGGGAGERGATPYRADSFVCAAAQHAGVIGARGGCGVLRLSGAYANYTASDAHGIQSVPFPSTFPSSFTLHRPAAQQDCADTRWKTYVLDVVFTVVVTFILRPKSIVLFWMLACVGFWHVNLVSEPRSVPPPVGAAVGDFGPHLFASYAVWRIAIRFVWPEFRHMPVEFGVGTLGLWWIGVLLNVVFENVPLNRLEGRDLAQQPGALSSLIVIIIVVVCLAINQVRVIRAAGELPKYLFLYVIAGLIIALSAAVPGEGVRLHHYIIGLALLPGCGFSTRISMLCCAFLYGMYTNGVARWGFDGLLQDHAVIQGDAVGSSLLPTFAANETALLADGVVRWSAIPAVARTAWDSFVLLVDDVVRYEGAGTQYNLTSLRGNFSSSPTGAVSELLSPTQLDTALNSSVHYLRLAYASAGAPGDFTMAALAWMNGSWVPPPPGRT
ncbi:Lethal(2) giant larvae sro7 [Malassezia sp. CBS 17886]|nr:Lethal(2) giant larvae sro7 [Malassezia sp. CBS 17886]